MKYEIRNSKFEEGRGGAGGGFLMRWGVAAAVLVMSFESVADAGAVVELVPQNPGPYVGGESFEVDVVVTADWSFDIQLLGLDFSATDPAITLPTEFSFDQSSLILDALYSDFPALPWPQEVYISTTPIPGFVLHVKEGVPFHAGSLAVTLPDQQGIYVLDAVNAEANSPGKGAWIETFVPRPCDFLPCPTEITGGQVPLRVIPEPATLALLALGAVAAVWLRRRGAGRRKT